MTLDTVYVLILRIVHITSGVFWVGTSMFLVIILEPTIESAGADGSRFASKLAASKMSTVFAAAAGITLLAGILLYIHNVAVIGGDWAKAGPGLVFGIGAIFGIAGGAVGGTIGSLTKKIAQLGKQIEASGAPPTAEQQQQMMSLNERLSRISRIDLGLVLVALVLMEVARYIPS
jgi:uncharacterized membrane protein